MSSRFLPIKRLVGFPLLGALLLSLPPERGAQALQLQEYQVKAAMVVNMARYVEWPSDLFPDSSGPLTVCVTGGGPFASALEELRGKSVKGHPLAVRRVASSEALGSCQILVLSDLEKRNLTGFITASRKKGVLTMSDAPNFAEHGGNIGFLEQDGRVHFEVNLATTQQARLRISSQLLKLARIVHSSE